MDTTSTTVSITPRSFIICLLMALPAGFAASVVAKVGDSFVDGLYRGAQWQQDDFYNLLTQFGTCALGGFLFVWFGALLTRKYTSSVFGFSRRWLSQRLWPWRKGIAF